MKKKWISLLLVLVMLLGSIASAESFWAEKHLSEETVEITIAVERFSLDASVSYEEKAFVQGLEEATNLKINWIEISQTTPEATNAILNSGELPDAFIGLLTDSLITQNTELFLPLNDLLEENVPNVLKYYEEHAPYWKEYLTFPDGNIYSLMGSFIPDYSYYLPEIFFINQAWLDRLNLEMPTTLAELENVLAAFRDQDANGNGDVSDEIPLAFCNNHWNSNFMTLASMFGITFPYNDNGRDQQFLDIVDGKVISTVDTPAYREFLTWANRAISEGLIDAEGFSETEEQYFAKLNAGRVGLFWGWMPGTFMSGAELQNEYVAFTPVAAEGYTARVGAHLATPNRIALVLSRDSKHPAEVLKLWDYLSQSPESSLYVAYGPEGMCYKYFEEEQKYGLNTPTDEEMIAAGYEDYVGSQGTSKFFGSLGLINYHPVVKNVNWVGKHDEREIGLAMMGDYLMSEYMSKAVVPYDAQEELDFTTDGLKEMIFENAANFALNGVTDESWNAYLANLETYGYPFYIDWYQNYLDGTF